MSEVWLLDDDAGVRRGLRRLLLASGVRATACATAAELLAALGEAPRGCVILDLDLGGGASGLDLQDELSQRHPTLPILFLSGRGSVATSVRAMKQGAVDFLEKPVEADALLAAIEAALHRGRDAELDALADAEAQAAAARLTEREREVFVLIARGCTNAEAGELLGIAAGTVKLHRARVMQKLEVHSVAELARMHARLESLT
ncbi:MAG: response regulator transcription factor [Deltaproteobacteria bacterium]|nr:response regulator transcription factor [Deltaproteobacteria bacterium]